MSKKHGEPSSLSDDLSAEEDFFYALESTKDLINEFNDHGLELGAALCGTLTTALAQLIRISPDKTSSMKLLSSCLHNAILEVESDKIYDKPPYLH